MSSKEHLRPCFLNLKSVVCDSIYHHASIKHYAHNEILYQQGDVPLNLYIFLSGALSMSKKTQQIMHCSVGELIGAHANFANIRYPETVKFLSAGDVIAIKFDYFHEKIMQDQILFRKMIEALLKKQKIVTNLWDVTIFKATSSVNPPRKHCFKQHG